MSIELTNQAVKSASFLAAQGIDRSRIARDFGIQPEVLFDVVEGVTVHYTTDSARVPCALMELRPPWTVNLPKIELDWKRLHEIRRERLQLSQAKLGEQIRHAGEVLLVPNGCSKRHVQYWEIGEYTMVNAAYQLAIAYVLGCDVETICDLFPAARLEECATQLVTLARLAEALLMLAGAYERLCELNERVSSYNRDPDAAHSVPSYVSAVSVSVPYRGHGLTGLPSEPSETSLLP